MYFTTKSVVFCHNILSLLLDFISHMLNVDGLVCVNIWLYAYSSHSKISHTNSLAIVSPNHANLYGDIIMFAPQNITPK